MITYNATGIDMPKIKKRVTTAWIKTVAATYDRIIGDIGYMFVNDDLILEYNKRYLGRNYHTDIITFDYDEGYVINGDVIISIDTVRYNAERFNTTFKDELDRVIIHGILHLCVINDETTEDFKRMKEEENKALSIR